MKKIYLLLMVLSLFASPVFSDTSRRPQRVMSAKQESKLRKDLRRRFGFELPLSATIMTTAASPSKATMYICVKMPVDDAVRFKQHLVYLRRPETQRFLYEDKNSSSRIGSLPAGEEPASIEAWQAENKFTGGETMLYIQNVKRIGEDELKSLSYLVMFSQESRGLAYFYFSPSSSI